MVVLIVLGLGVKGCVLFAPYLCFQFLFSLGN